MASVARSPAGAGLVLELASLAGAVAILVATATVYLHGGFVDDTFILFRYAQNLAAGQGFAWDAGGTPVEGFSSTLWVVLLAAGHLVSGAAIPRVAVTLGLGCTSLALLLVGIATRLALAPPLRWLAGLAPLALALSPIPARHAISGMETSLVMAELAGAAVLWAWREPALAPRLLALAALSFVALLTRADAILPIVVGTAVIALPAGLKRADLMRAALWYAAPLALLIAAYLAWKLATFGAVLPLPAYMKLGPERITRTGRLARWVFNAQSGFVSHVAPLLLAIAVGVLVRPRSQKPVVWAGLAAAGAFFLYMFGVVPVMGFEWRFKAPLMAPLAVAAVAALIPAIDHAVAEASRSAVAKLAAAALIAIMIGANVGTFYVVKMAVADAPLRPYIALGRALASLPGLSIAYSEAGAIPYYSGARFLDVAGLNDAFIARNRFRPDFDRTFRTYVLDRYGLPDVWIDPPDEYGYARLARQPDLARHYVRVEAPPFALYMRRDSPLRDAILDRIAAYRRAMAPR